MAELREAFIDFSVEKTADLVAAPGPPFMVSSWALFPTPQAGK
jgi:hypothetical protein